MVTICRTYHFQSAHFLPHVPDGHKCKNMHGHTYQIEVRLVGEVQADGPERGMIVDYGKVDVVWDPIHKLLDHRLLNEVPGLENPTVEIMAPFILEIFRTAIPEVVSVRLQEGLYAWCEARRDE